LAIELYVQSSAPERNVDWRQDSWMTDAKVDG